MFRWNKKHFLSFLKGFQLEKIVSDLTVHFSSNKFCCHFKLALLTLSWRRPLSYRNQSIDLPSKSLDWFLYVNGLRYERVKDIFVGTIIIGVMITKINKDVIFDLNTLPHKLLDSIRLNAQTIMRPPIFVSLFTACPLFSSAALKPSATKREKSPLSLQSTLSNRL